MGWVIAIVWGIAVLLALVLLGFCGYEITWKTRRLERDLAGLVRVQDDLRDVQQRLAAAQQRAMTLRPSRPR